MGEAGPMPMRLMGSRALHRVVGTPWAPVGTRASLRAPCSGWPACPSSMGRALGPSPSPRSPWAPLGSWWPVLPGTPGSSRALPRARPPGGLAAASPRSRAVAAPVEKPPEEVAPGREPPDRPQGLLTLPPRGLLRPLPLALRRRLPEHAARRADELVAPLARQRRSHAVVARHLAEGPLAPDHARRHGHLELRAVRPLRCLRHLSLAFRAGTRPCPLSGDSDCLANRVQESPATSVRRASPGHLTPYRLAQRFVIKERAGRLGFYSPPSSAFRIVSPVLYGLGKRQGFGIQLFEGIPVF